MAQITGYGAVSSLGRGTSAIWSALESGRDGLAPIRRFDPSDVGVSVAGMVPDVDTHDGPTCCAELAVAAAREAWQHAGLDRVRRERIALVLGSSLGDRAVAIQRITEVVGDTLAIGGPRLTVTTACASSANAIGIALDLLRLGVADAVIAGGADVLTPLVLAGFHALGVLAPGKCAPFSEPAGTTLGEGAGFVVVERAGAGEASLLGYGLSADAFHDTGPDPSGAGVARALRAALAHAGLDPSEVEYINAHGTGTRANDPAEWRAIRSVLGSRAEAIPVSSSKSFLGHAQGAAGALETIATLVAMEHDAIPPTQRFTVARPNSPTDPVGQATARSGRWRVAVATLGFGGANCALVLGRGTRSLVTAGRQPISIAGIGSIGPHGRALPSPATRARGHVVPFRIEDVVDSIDPRGLDPTTRYLLAATALALADANVRLHGDARDHSGFVVGQAVASPQSDAALHDTLARHGFRGLSASLFARQVVNAAPGTCARLLGLRGAHSTVSAGAATGLFALVYAAELLATRTELDRIVAAGVDELPPARDPSASASEGAASTVLVRGHGLVEVAGWSVAGPGRLRDAIAGAMAMAEVERADVAIGCELPGALSIDPAQLLGTSDGFTSAAAALVATSLIRAGDARHVIVACCGGASADCAVLLRRGEPHA